MIIEWILNALVAIIKLPFSLLHIPSVDISSMLNTLNPYIFSSLTWVRFFFDDFCIGLFGFVLSIMALFKVIDIISTIVGFFKKSGD